MTIQNQLTTLKKNNQELIKPPCHFRNLAPKIKAAGLSGTKLEGQIHRGQVNQNYLPYLLSKQQIDSERTQIINTVVNLNKQDAKTMKNGEISTAYQDKKGYHHVLISMKTEDRNPYRVVTLNIQTHGSQQSKNTIIQINEKKEPELFTKLVNAYYNPQKPLHA